MPPALFDDRSYDERQIASGDLAAEIEIFLNRWHWRGDREVVRKELKELIAFARSDGLS